MGTHTGDWVHDQDSAVRGPATEFGIARKTTYRKSKEGRNVLPEASYAQAFGIGTIDAALTAELKRRRSDKRGAGHIDAAP
jgi:hypothetical protein